MSKPSFLAEPILVGREKELEQLQLFLNSAVEGKGKTVFVSGEAGSGKTRLTKELLNAAAKRGVTVMAGWCLSDTAAPYFPFVEAFNNYFAGQEPETADTPSQPVASIGLSEPIHMITEERGVTAWLTRIQPTSKTRKPQALSPQVWKDQLFVGVAKTLHTIAMQNPVVLFIEDAQWADSASLMLLLYIARAIRDSERVLLLATYRSEELTTDAEGRAHPLAETLRMIAREELFSEIKLSGLNQENASRIAESMIGGTMQPGFAEKLTTESKGNPLFIVESLRMLHERKSLIRENSQWRLAVDELGIPNKIKDIIRRRLACLKFDQRRVLDVASVIGEKFDVELLSTVLGLDSLEVLETLNAIAHLTSLVSVEENLYRFDHARSRETLYEELSPPLKRGYHARIAEKLESAKNTALPLSDLAYHYAQSGNKEKAIKYAIEAGKDALAKFSSSQAISHFTYALQALGEEPQHVGQRAVALEGLGDAFYANNMFEEAVKTFESLGNTNMGAVKLRALTKAMYAAYFQGDYPRIEELVRRAEEYGNLNQLERARVLHFKGVAASGLHKGTAKEWLRLYEEALRIFEEEYALSDAAWLLFVLADITAYVASLIGEMEKPLAMCLRSIAIYDELGDFRSQMEAYNQAGSVFSAYALYPEALGMFEKVFEIEQKTKMGNYIMLAKSSAFSAQLAELTGDFAGSVTKGLKALEYSEKSGSYLFLGITYSYLVIGYVKLGNMPRAEEYFAKLTNLPQRALMGIYTMFIDLAKAVYFAGKNQWEQSTEQFNELMAFYTASPNIATHIPALENYAWALEKQGKKSEAKKILQGIDSVVVECAEKVKHTHVQADLTGPIDVTAGQAFEVRLDLANVSRSSGLLLKIQDMLPKEFQVTAAQPEVFRDNSLIQLKDNKLEPFTVKTIKLTLKATKAGTFELNPKVIYVDDLGQTKTITPRPIAVTVKPAEPSYAALPGRVTTGTTELDRLLLGGIPEEYSVVLAAPSIDERQLLINRFVEAGPEKGEVTFYLTCNASKAEELARNFRTNFYVSVCNPQADLVVASLPNIIKLKGTENLTEIDIALAKLFRTLKLSQPNPKRFCLDLLSDVLLQHHAVTTRRWLSGLLASLKSKGFTVLAVIDPSIMSEEVSAISSLFDGEIRVAERETDKGMAKMLRVLKLQGQTYLKDEVNLA